MHRSCTVLLTATLLPSQYDFGTVVRADLSTRTQDYIAALKFWDSLPDNRIEAIVFCDNSGEDLSAIRDAMRCLRKPAELLGFRDHLPPPDLHYGYGELGIIDYAVQNSHILSRSPFFIKSTGRLRFPRITALLDALPDACSGVADHRRRYRREAGPPTRTRTQLMLFTPDCYAATLFDRRDEMRGRFSHIEEFLAHELQHVVLNQPFLRRFPVECPPSGVGGNGHDYDCLTEQCKAVVRGMARRWLPHVWL